jgi:TolB protein
MNRLSVVLSIAMSLAIFAGCSMAKMWSSPSPAVRTLTHNGADNLAPSWSPDGQQLVFESDLAGNWDLWVIHANGSHLRQLTREPSAERFAAWSPDGRKIVFSSNQSGSWDLWAMNDGSQPEQLTRMPQDELAPAWSQDGTRLAFVSQRTDLRQVLTTPHMGDYGIWVMKADGSGIVELQPNCGDWGPSWSPDGTAIVNAASSQGMSGLRLFHLDTGSIQILTPQSDVPQKRRDFLPAWSPNGQAIAFISTRDGQRDIWLIDPAGAWERRVTHGLFRHLPRHDMDHRLYNGIGYYDLAWSPDNTQIAFTVINRSGKGDIALVEAGIVQPVGTGLRGAA